LLLFLYRTCNADQDIIELLKNGFKGLEKRITTLSENARTPKAATWAGVAAAALQTPVVVPQWIRIPEAANKSVAELLAKVKPIIPGAYAVRQLILRSRCQIRRPRTSH
jgi:hypothetical protein